MKNFWISVLFLSFYSSNLFGQATRTPVAVKRASAVRVNEAPTIDGDLSDAVWQRSTPEVDFTQTEPTEGQPATERTEVRLLYDDKNFYVGVICYDSEPSKLVTTDSRRDSSLGGQDNFQFILDTYHDRQNGFIFGTTPVGLQYDAQVRNEGETIRGGPPTGGAGGSTGAGAGVNANWDGSWDVKTKVTDTGWTAEFVIPLRTLRYGSAPQTWGINFARSIERKREATYWSPVARIYSLTRLSSAGELRGLDVPTPRDFKLMPYASGSAVRNFLAKDETAYDLSPAFGIDSKIGVTSSTTLDLTYNTDFAQVEVDEQQINLTRFNVLFPEKRPFFLENRGLFAVGRPGEIDLFFSRAIGIHGVDLIPIQTGARLTGKAHGVNVGLLNMQTEKFGTFGESDFTSANNFTAARVSKDLRNRSSVGAIFVNRVGFGEGSGNNSSNQTFGVDGRLGVGEAVSVSGFAARTVTPFADRSESAFSGALDYRTRKWETQSSYAQVGDDFNPEVGYLERPDGYRQIGLALRRHVRTPTLARHGLREWEPHASFESYWGYDTVRPDPAPSQRSFRPETATLHVDSRLDFENGLSLGSTALNVQYEGLREPFEVYKKTTKSGTKTVVVPPGDYRSPYFLTMGNTDRRKWISAGMSLNAGGFLSGHQLMLQPSLNIRKEGLITSTLRWTHNNIDLPEGSFVTNLVAGRVTYNFSPLVNVSSLLQYNDRTNRWSTNLRLTWLRTAATGLYVVYNDTEGFDSPAVASFIGSGPTNRAFIVKYSHQIDVLN